MTSPFIIRKCTPEELVDIQAYIDCVWRKGHILARDRAFLEWQFSAPGTNAGPEILVLVANDGTGDRRSGRREGQIMGMRGLIPYAFNLKGRQVRGTWTGNLHCREEARTTGWSLKLITWVHGQDFAFVCVIGMNGMMKRIYKALRYHIIESLPRVVGVTDEAATLGLLRKGLGGNVSDELIVNQCRRHLVAPRGIANGPADICVDWTPAWEDSWDIFWRGSLAKSLICTDRSSAYVNWRYRDHRWFKYRIYLSVEPRSKRASGLLVYRIEKIRDHELLVIRIVELLARDEGAWRALLAKVLGAAVESRAVFCDFFCSSNAVLDAIAPYGFVRCEETPGAAVFPSRFQPLDFAQTKIAGAILPSKNTRATLDPDWADQLYVTKSDGDQDRPV